MEQTGGWGNRILGHVCAHNLNEISLPKLGEGKTFDEG